MGANSSIHNIFESSPSENSSKNIKQGFNFSGIKDLTKNSYFSCLCTNNEPNAIILDECPSPEFPGNVRKSLPLLNSNQDKVNKTPIGSFRSSTMKLGPSNHFDNELDALSKQLRINGKCMGEIKFKDEIDLENSEASMKNISFSVESPIIRPSGQDSLFFNDS